jgi:hypothetical protein
LQFIHLLRLAALSRFRRLLKVRHSLLIIIRHRLLLLAVIVDAEAKFDNAV